MLATLIAYLLSAAGLTILLVWPEDGPGSWLREKVLRPLLPEKARGVLDCYICSGFWCGLAMSALWWSWYREPWLWTGCLMIPALFWFVLRSGKAGN
ncbi:hypothetical protein SAMN05444156_0509 [Verrucomicrobium sp. GAS474]|uniref:hypothetical protein n=1 Tax=Verrucomicrobium sp. GAS474 TaxID=1882831 RepID=UPI00087BB862|nr:hypothetical protein [Verrucomicrobium sp. GAS474]SDT89475.1 hypothetical protein SAMN05444156_0509 [Verrucomicrobium sp. GAS474]